MNRVCRKQVGYSVALFHKNATQRDESANQQNSETFRRKYRPVGPQRREFLLLAGPPGKTQLR